MSLHSLLFGTDRFSLISVVGGGGKTSVLRTLANEYLAEGLKVAVTTTTKMKHPEPRSLLAWRVDEIEKKLQTNRFVVVGKPFDDRKIGLVDPVVFEKTLHFADVTINEADGAKMLPLKAPIISEPVLPLKTDIVVIVVGLDCIGRKLKETCFRVEEVMKILKTDDENKRITPREVTKIIEKGYLDKTPFPCVVLLNKADNNPARLKAAEKISYYLTPFKCVTTSLFPAPKIF